ncbi:MAG: hypothetical protein QG622_3136 [Actinomycetota bacterium]|nr:hypothetical protein [Actinomycetota bacterium]
MGERIVVDTAALEAAAGAAVGAARETRASLTGADVLLRRAAASLTGSRSGPAVAAVAAGIAVALGELAQDLDDLGNLLASASARYAEAENASVLAVTVPGGPVS